MRVGSRLGVSLVFLMLSGFVMGSEVVSPITTMDLFEVVEKADGTSELVKVGDRDDRFYAPIKGQAITQVNIGNILMMTKEIIALGKEIYKVVDSGKPSVEVVTEPVQVLPRGEDGAAVSAFNLSGWSAPLVKKYVIKSKNYLGMTPVIFEFQVISTFGGSHDGKGSYLTGVQIKPSHVGVKWGYDFNASFKVQTIVNEGSSEDPVAGATLMLDTMIKTPLQEDRLSQTFYVNGLGEMISY